MAAQPDPALGRASIQAVAREVAAILGRTDGRLLTAQQVAERFNVERGWVYAHAEELGVVRLGQGPRPRLRFDGAIVAQLMLVRRGREIAPGPSMESSTDAPLLPIRGRRRDRMGGH